MKNKISCSLCRLATAWPPAQKQLLRITSLFICVLLIFSFVPFDAFAASSQENLIYNGFELPPPPEGVDSYVIVKTTFGDSPNSGTTALFEVSDFTVYNVDGSLILHADSCYRAYLSPSWSPASLSLDVKVSNLPIIFSTNDIFYADSDEIFYHGSEPLSPSDAGLYSYNGFIAPSISNYNPEFYYLMYLNSDDEIILDVTDAIFTHTPSSYPHCLSFYDGSYRSGVQYHLDNNSWVFDVYLASNWAVSFNVIKSIIWTNFDIPTCEYHNSITGSDPVPLYDTSVYTIVSQDDDYSLELGQSSLLQLYNPRGTSARGDWSIVGNSSEGTFITENSPDADGLALSATLQIGDNEESTSIIVYCSFINTQNQFTTKTFYINIEPPSTASYSIVRTGNPFDDFVPGGIYYFQAIDSNDSTASGLYAEWSISGENINELTSISSTGQLSISPLQEPTTIIITAANINHSGQSATYTVNVLTGGGGEGGDTPTPSPTPGTSDVIDSVDKGFTDLGDKVDKLGESIVSGLLEGLLRLFIPTAEDLSAQMDGFKSWIDEQIPILAVPVAFVQFTYDLFFGVTPELGSLSFPEIKWMDHVLIQNTDLNLEQYTWLTDLLPIIRTTLTAACCFAFVNWLINKVKEISKI